MKKRNFRFITLFVVCLIFGLKTGFSQIEKFQVAYIYNITRYIEWPAEYKQGNFVIGVLGKNEKIIPELQTIASAKKVLSQSIEIKEFATVQDIQKCNVLFIPDSQSKNVSSASASIGSKATLIIANNGSALNNGAAINFVVSDNKLQFELKKANIENKGLTMSSSLSQLASKTY